MNQRRNPVPTQGRAIFYQVTRRRETQKSQTRKIYFETSITFYSEFGKKLAKTSCSKWLRRQTLVVANLSDTSVNKVRSSNHTYTARGPIHNVVDGRPISQACTAHAKCQGQGQIIRYNGQTTEKNLGSIPRQEQGISLVYKASRPSLGPTQPTAALTTSTDVRTSGFTPPLTSKPSTVCKKKRIYLPSSMLSSR
jgi:hypothetical protein